MLWSALPQFVLLYCLSVCIINFQPHSNPHFLSRSRPPPGNEAAAGNASSLTVLGVLPEASRTLCPPSGITDPNVSRNHASLEVKEDHVVVTAQGGHPSWSSGVGRLGCRSPFCGCARERDGKMQVLGKHSRNGHGFACAPNGSARIWWSTVWFWLGAVCPGQSTILMLVLLGTFRMCQLGIFPGAFELWVQRAKISFRSGGSVRKGHLG